MFDTNQDIELEFELPTTSEPMGVTVTALGLSTVLTVQAGRVNASLSVAGCTSHCWLPCMMPHHDACTMMLAPPSRCGRFHGMFNREAGREKAGSVSRPAGHASPGTTPVVWYELV